MHQSVNTTEVDHRHTSALWPIDARGAGAVIDHSSAILPTATVSPTTRSLLDWRELSVSGVWGVHSPWSRRAMIEPGSTRESSPFVIMLAG
jgi:hypothetical protein